MQNDAHSVSKPRTPNLYPFEERLLKSVEAVSTKLTELSDSWRSMDSALVLKALAEIESATGGIAESLQQMRESLMEINITLWRQSNLK